MPATVGETRAWLEAAYGIPHAPDTHFVIVTHSPDGLGITGCCDGTDEAGVLLATALRAISGEARPAPESGSVIVFRDDLTAELAGKATEDARARLAEAAGVAPVTGTGWTATREQLIDALANIEVHHVHATGPMAGKVIADDVADAILAQLPQAHAITEYAVAWGGEDPNDCAGILVYDDEAEAEEHVQWIRDSYVARRTVTCSRWERVAGTVTDGATVAPERSAGTGAGDGTPGAAESTTAPGGDRP